MIKLPEQVNKAICLLKNSGFEAYAVGGAVRDCLLGKVPFDWDITTSARPEETEKVFCGERIIETGIKHGTVTVIIDDMPLEITTYRIDGDYTDHRHPQTVSFSDNLRDDLSRRDFTINTLCCNCDDKIIDVFGGKDDLKNKTIRCVGDPDTRFSEDALRIMRAVRFSAELGFKIEKSTSDSILKNRRLLSDVSKERLQVEFTKLITGKYATDVIRKYHAVIEVFIPELAPLVECEQHTKYHKYDVFEHTLYAVDAIDFNDRILRLTMFFHDFGKPDAKTTDENGTSHFKGHAVISEKKTRNILKRLKFDNNTINEVSKLVLIHDMKSPRDKIQAKKMMCSLGDETYLNLIKIKRADNMAKADPHAIDEKLKNMRSFYEEIKASNECYNLKSLAVNGDDIKAFGIAEGKEIKSSLDFLLNGVIEGKCQNRKDVLLEYLKENTK